MNRTAEDKLGGARFTPADGSLPSKWDAVKKMVCYMAVLQIGDRPHSIPSQARNVTEYQAF